MTTLEPRVAAHAEALFAILSDRSLYEFLDELPPESVEALRERFRRSEALRSPDGSEQWLNWVVRDGSGTIAGYVQATIFANRETNVAYLLGREHWGRGLAGEAVATMLDRLARDFGVRRCHVVVDRRNERSIRLARRLGFAEDRDAVDSGLGVASGDVLMRKPLSPPAER
jgi:ribosomal-protein-alanine N-acetyltransferase